MDRRNERVLVETDRHRIAGTITLPRTGYLSRTSDYLNEDEIFLSLTDAEVIRLDGGEPERLDFVAVGRQHIRLVIPLGA